MSDSKAWKARIFKKTMERKRRRRDEIVAAEANAWTTTFMKRTVRNEHPLKEVSPPVKEVPPPLKEAPALTPLSHDAKCDVCSKWIVGIRYKSREKVDYDLCQNCYEQSDNKASFQSISFGQKSGSVKKAPKKIEPIRENGLYIIKFNKTYRGTQKYHVPVE
jgi:hypothetical protein